MNALQPRTVWRCHPIWGVRALRFALTAREDDDRVWWWRETFRCLGVRA